MRLLWTKKALLIQHPSGLNEYRWSTWNPRRGEQKLPSETKAEQGCSVHFSPAHNQYSLTIPRGPTASLFFSKMKPHFQCLSFETSPVHAHIPVSFLESHSKPVGSCGGINRVTPPHQVTWQKTCLWTIWCLTLTKGLAKLMDINAGRLKNQSDNPYLHVSCAPL